MELSRLGDQYIDNSEKIAVRIAELQMQLQRPMSLSKKKTLLHRIRILDDLRLEQRTTGHYLQKYYAR